MAKSSASLYRTNEPNTIRDAHVMPHGERMQRLLTAKRCDAKPCDDDEERSQRR